MTDPNVQDRNVGNRGDVIKHAALVALASALRARNPGLVRHAETHTFRLHAPLPDPTRWHAAITTLPPGPARNAYTARQAPWVARGLYRCSAGLAADTLGAPMRLLLAEAHAPTHAALAAALAAEGLPFEALVHDAGALALLPAPAVPAPLLVHVDPFDHPLAYWDTVTHLLTTWRRPKHDAVVLAFACDKATPLTWPAPPADLLPLGRLDAAPYGLAAWASPGFAPDARAALAALGWDA
jgi:hypothetical protein